MNILGSNNSPSLDPCLLYRQGDRKTLENNKELVMEGIAKQSIGRINGGWLIKKGDRVSVSEDYESGGYEISKIDSDRIVKVLRDQLELFVNMEIA